MNDMNTPTEAPPPGVPQPPFQAPPRRRRFLGLGTRAATAVTAVGLMAGGVAGGFIVSNAATGSTSSSTSTGAASTASGATAAAGGSSAAAPSPGAADGKFVPNEDPTHEAGESAAREAQENAGQRPTIP